MTLLVAGLLAPMTRSGIDFGTSLYFILVLLFSLSWYLSLLEWMHMFQRLGYDLKLLPNHRAVGGFSSVCQAYFWIRWCLGLSSFSLMNLWFRPDFKLAVVESCVHLPWSFPSQDVSKSHQQYTRTPPMSTTLVLTHFSHQGPVLLTFLRHVARISANGIAAFKESCSPIG